jgi:hypothetical protein
MGPSSTRRGLRWACLGGLLLAAGCDGSGGGVYVLADASTTRIAPDGGLAPGNGVGQACGPGDVCRSGLSCTSGKCAPCGCLGVAAECVISDECSAGSFCGPARTCAPVGSGVAGDSCISDATCGQGLRCDLVGLSAACQPEGMSDVGGPCSTSGDCFGGLGCMSASPDGGAPTCQPYPPPPGGVAPIAVPTWPGETCTDPTGATQAYFRVPRGTADGDFYRLPFPNDVRLSDRKIDLTGHPTPGSALLGYDLVQRWLTDLSATADGFSTYPTVFFRFSAQVDQGNTLKAAGAIRWIDITQPASAVDVAFNWTTTTDRNAYICNNWIGLRPSMGEPLTPGHTYAVVLSTGILDAQQQPIQVSPDLTALLGAAAPGDPTLAAQWPKYQPLRDWAQNAAVAASAILDATVFTVGHPATLASKLPAAVAAAQPPPATQWIRCGEAPSPCPQATGDRACGTPDPAFDEVQALVPIPIFQEGTPPYETSGGDFVLGADGTPQLQRYEAVCMDLTVPKGVAMPAGGWPLLIYAPGTGGSYRSAITDGVSAREAAIDDGAGGTYHVAVLGIDQVEAGPRRGTSQESSDNLFYNFSNPPVARGNPLQGAADQMSLVRFVSTLALTAAQSPTGAAIKFGPLAFWGHSQGATEGGLAMPYTAGIKGAVLSGEGASVIDGLLGKKNPVDIADVLPVAIEEDPTKMGVYHPVLALLQNDLDGVDPLNHAGALIVAPGSTAVQKHVFQPFGQGDTYAPPSTEQTFAIAAHLAEVVPGGMGVTGSPIAGVPLPAPLGGNATVLGTILTAVVRQYAPGPKYDGHFVAYDNAAAEADVDHFIGDALAGKAPKVGR